jgi:hypothetical protein
MLKKMIPLLMAFSLACPSSFAVTHKITLADATKVNAAHHIIKGALTMSAFTALAAFTSYLNRNTDYGPWKPSCLDSKDSLEKRIIELQCDSKQICTKHTPIETYVCVNPVTKVSKEADMKTLCEFGHDYPYFITATGILWSLVPLSLYWIKNIKLDGKVEVVE